MKYFVIFSIFITSYHLSLSKDYYHFELIKTIDSTYYNSKNKTFINRLKDFIFGSEEIKIKKPYSIFAIDTNHFFLIDHFYPAPLLCNLENDKIELIEKENNYFFPSMNTIIKINEKILFSDSKNNFIYAIDENKNISVFIDSSFLKQPTGISYNTLTKSIYVSSTAEHKVKIFNQNGTYIKEIGQRGNDSLSFNYPTFSITDNEGNLYILDNLNYKIKTFNHLDKFVYSFGEHSDQIGYFAFPKGFAIDSNNNIYLADAFLKTVQIFSQKGDFLLNLDNQKYNIFFPTSVFIDKNNFIYITDYYGSKILIFKLVKDENNEK